MRRPKFELPSKSAFTNGLICYRSNETREPAYNTSRFVLEHADFSNLEARADAVANFLYSWNHAFYQGKGIKVPLLRGFLRGQDTLLRNYSGKHISLMTEQDLKNVEELFMDLHGATSTFRGTEQVHSSVSAAKGLHILMPQFCPMWDEKIAKAYDCNYSNDPGEAYVRFVLVVKTFAAYLEHEHSLYGECDPKIVKQIDEYNFAKFTRGWV